MTAIQLATLADATGLPSGTSFPGSPANNDLFYRTDYDMLFFYDGTRWLSTNLFTDQNLGTLFTNTTTLGDLRSAISATASTVLRMLAPYNMGASDIWLVAYRVVFQVNGGTALSGSHKWVGTFQGFDAATSVTGTAATVNIDSGSSSVFRELNTTIGAARVAGTLWYAMTWTKTGTPGSLQTGEQLIYRIIAT